MRQCPQLGHLARRPQVLQTNAPLHVVPENVRAELEIPGVQRHRGHRGEEGVAQGPGRAVGQDLPPSRRPVSTPFRLTLCLLPHTCKAANVRHKFRRIDLQAPVQPQMRCRG